MKSEIPPLKPQLIGTRVTRTEDAKLLTGRARYIADIALPDTLAVAILRSPYAHARMASIDTTAAAALPGVRLVWTGADTSPRSSGVAAGHPIEGMKGTVQPVLATDVVHYVGEPVAAVVATSRAVAEDACELIEVDYEELPAVVDAEAAIAGGPMANETVEDNVILRGVHTVGNVDSALEAAAVRVEGRFVSNRCTAAPLETRGCLASHEWTTGQLTLWSSTQIPHLVRAMLAMYLGFPEQHLEVIAPEVGGGFGQKAHLFPEELLVCLLTQELGRPVRWIEDRRENILAATHARGQINTVGIGFDGDGHITAMKARSVGDGGAYNCFPWTQLVEPMAGTGQFTSVYKTPALQTEFVAAVTNKCPVGAYRGIGWTAPQIARESLLDVAARRLSLSPFEIRRRNVVQPEEFPYTAATGLTFLEGSYRETVDSLEAAVDYPTFLERQRRGREEGRYLGLGVSVFNELNGMGSRACFETGFPVTGHDTSSVRVDPTGKVVVTTSVVSQGQGHATTLAQVAADALGLPLSDVVLRAGSTAQTWGLGTWGSRGAVIGAGSILRAAHVVRERIRQVAANLLEAAPDDIVFEAGRVHVAGTPAQGMAFAEVVGAIYFAEPTHPPGFDPALEATCAYDPSHSAFSNGGHAVIVEVDPETGVVSFERIIAVEDCGVMINPAIVEGQIRGGIAQAIGEVLLEDIAYDDRGQVLTSTLMEYLLPTATDVPDIEIIHLETPSAHTPGGIKGMGESAMISAPAAIVNAVNDALVPLGVFLDRYPLSPDRIESAVAAARPVAR